MRYAQLTSNARERAREQVREVVTDHEWWECVYKDAYMILEFLGFTSTTIYFSGFWSQGDGACFTGNWSPEDVQVGKVKEHAPVDGELHRIAGVIEEVATRYTTIAGLDPDNVCGIDACEFTLSHSSSCYHEYTIRFEGGASTAADEEAFEDACRDLMRWIYQQLEKEYNYLTSDEHVEEAIEANDWRFDRDGRFAQRRAA